MSHRFAPGWRIGHWSDEAAATGCTVLLPPRGNVASCDVRGSSPSSRELELLHPDRRLTEIHGIVLTGGSAFGLAAADGVVHWLADRDIGYQTGVARVPIVPAAVIFDLGCGSSDVRPGPEEGAAACDALAAEAIPTGRVGAGTGATVGKWAGVEHASPGGLGIALGRSGRSVVAALAVVNPVGDVIAEDGSVLAGTRSPDPRPRAPLAQDESSGAVVPGNGGGSSAGAVSEDAGGSLGGAVSGDAGPPGGAVSGDAGSPGADMPGGGTVARSTVLAVVATDARLDKRDARWLASRGSDGITISVRPAHTRYDGDVVFAVAAAGRAGGAELDDLGRAATDAVAAAVRAAVAPWRRPL
ncbi:MAG: P1 family peptidase [Actinomycetota bacterium]